MGESLATGGSLARVTTREDIKIATINDITKNKISGDDGNIGGDIGGDGPDVVFDVIFGLDDDTTIPRSEAEEIATRTYKTFGGKGRVGSYKTKYRGGKSDDKPRDKNFLS